MNEFIPNPGKSILKEYEGTSYLRIPVKTHVISKDDKIIDVIKKYTSPLIRDNDYIFVSEKIVAIMQGRAFKIDDIKPSWLAKFLVKFVHKSPHGIGLGSPWTMELAIREVGALRILFAALISAITKPFGIRGLFYKVVGNDINAIDGPCDYTIPPYNNYAKLGPKDPNLVAKGIKKELGNEVVIIDANDIGVNVLGKSSDSIDEKFYREIFSDNPLGQKSEQTPICLVRKI